VCFLTKYIFIESMLELPAAKKIGAEFGVMSASHLDEFNSINQTTNPST